MGLPEPELKALREGCLQFGWSKPDDIKPHGLVSQTKAERFFQRLYKLPKEVRLSVASPRLVNHFSLGADPEFCFLSRNGEKYSADNFGLNTGGCAGADGNARLGELRAAPSRQALRVTASLLAAFRWLAISKPQTLGYAWVAFPYVHGDGVGGHVLFGRLNRETRNREIAALDTTMDLLSAVDVFNKLSNSQRQEQTEYGRHGDVRDQPFGYEYRTMPTWLDSPWLAFLTLTIAKLIVHTKLDFKPPYAYAHLKNLLATYKSVDDDALLAYNTLVLRGLPRQNYTDIKPAWGIEKLVGVSVKNYMEPRAITPSDEETRELGNHFVVGLPLAMSVPQQVLSSKPIPPGYATALSFNWESHRGYGMGELMSGLVMHQDDPITLEPNEGSNIYVGSRFYTPKLCDLARKILPKGVSVLVRDCDSIRIGRMLRCSHPLKAMREFLTSGLFPIWHINDVRDASYAEWKKRNNQNTFSKAPVKVSSTFIGNYTNGRWA